MAKTQSTEQQQGVTVKMKTQTVHAHNGNLYRLWPGMEVTVDEAVADQWVAVGMAEETGGSKRSVALGNQREFQAASDRFRAGSPVVQEVQRQDLRIASRHGDVAAARALDAMGDTGPLPQTNPDGTPPPLTLTSERAPGENPDDDEADDDDEEVDTQDTTEGEQPAAPTTTPTATARRTTGASARSALGGR